MLKSNVFIVSLLIKNRNIYVYLYTFNSVIINITNLPYQLVCKLIDNKRIPTKSESFFLCKNLPLLTI